MDPEALIPPLLGSHDAVRSTRLVGSRAQGRQTDLSDWDFLVETDDLDRLWADLPVLVAPLTPLAAQWDRLSEEASYYMLMLPDGLKADLVFEYPPELQPAWEVNADTLGGIDDHFWDWIMWLGGKQLGGRTELLEGHLGGLMLEHLLSPLGVDEPPASIAGAVAAYRAARDAREHELGVAVPRALEEAVLLRLESAGLLTR